MSMKKILPKAEAIYDYGMDGRDLTKRYRCVFSCPKCGQGIREKETACDECGTFFDWSKTPVIKEILTVEWREKVIKNGN